MRIENINQSSVEKDSINIVSKNTITLPVTPLFCLNSFAQNNRSGIHNDSKEKAKLLTCLLELSKRSVELGIEGALSKWNGKDYKARADWNGKYGQGNNCYSLRTYNKSAYRICNSMSPTVDVANRVVFHIWDVVNEKN